MNDESQRIERASREEPEDEDERYLDELLGRLIEAIAEGRPNQLEEEIARRPELEEKIREAREIARQVAPRQPTTLPEIEGYELLEELGHGGMGAVYLAHQQALDRRVAVKVVAAQGVRGTRAFERFAREVRVAGRLQHPNIVPVYEVGESQGTPYFTMEYVDGFSLSRLLDNLRRGAKRVASLVGRDFATAAGLEEEESPERWSRSYVEAACRILCDIADALEHAHESGILHRDVKPSNILVRRDGRAMLFDFGIARGEQDATLTRTGDVVGTPLYLSPEQVQGTTLDRTTDVYSLGVCLYEALTLRAPFAAQNTQEIYKNILAVEPPSPRSVNPELARDLETICLKALEKDKRKRYQSAAEMQADLRRFLELKPISARPTGVWTKSLRFVQRNKAMSASVALALLVLLGLPVGLLLHQSSQLRLQSESNLQIQAEAERARTIFEFLQDMIQSADPADLGREVKVVDVLDRKVAELESSPLDHHPELEVVLRNIAAKTYLSLGLPDSAEPILVKALALAEAFEEHDPDRIQTLHLLGIAKAERCRYVDAERLLVRAEALASATHGVDSIQRLEVARDLARVKVELLEFDEGIRLLESVAEISRRVVEEDPSILVDSLLGLAVAQRERGRMEEAGRAVEEAFDLTRTHFGERHPKHLKALGVKAAWLTLNGEQREAIRLLRESVPLVEARYGLEHPVRLELLNNLAFVLMSARRDDGIQEAEELLQEVLPIARASLAKDHLTLFSIRNNLALALADQGKLAAAEPLLRELAEDCTRSYGPAHRQTLTGQNNLGFVLMAQGKIEQAQELARTTLEERVELLGEDHPETVLSAINLANYLDQGKRSEEAEPYYLQALDQEKSLAPLQRAVLYSSYGMCLYRLGRTGEAKDLLLVGYQAFVDEEARDHGQFPLLLEALVLVHERLSEPEEAAAYRAELDALGRGG